MNRCSHILTVTQNKPPNANNENQIEHNIKESGSKIILPHPIAHAVPKKQVLRLGRGFIIFTPSSNAQIQLLYSCCAPFPPPVICSD